jgi:nicotinate dehydrogenase subunit B
MNNEKSTINHLGNQDMHNPMKETSEPHATVSRRKFLKLLGGGILICISPENIFALQERGRRFGQEEPLDFNAYLHIAEDGLVSCFTGKIEMGQGIFTSLAQMLAEELEVPLGSVKMVMGDTDLCPWDMGTFGSRSTKYFGPVLRQAAAEAREVLIQLASEHLQLPKSRLKAQDGFVLDRNNPLNKISYASLTKGKKIEKNLEGKPPLKPMSDYEICGEPYERLDAREKVTGRAEFAGDIRLPDMLYAKILRPPAHRAKLKSVDVSAAKGLKDVQVVRDGDLIAVLHPTPDGAEKALAKIKAQFDVPDEKLDNQNIFEHLVNVAPEGNIVDQKGDLEKGRSLASVTFEETYLNKYVAHAPLEPHTALAKVEGDKATLWVSTQRPFGDKDEVAQALGIPAENVRVITPFVGGGFGGKTRNQQAVEAARLAKLAGRPVQVAWTRKEEFFYDTFQPAAVIKIKSGIDNQGKVVFWDYMIFHAGERTSQVFYDIPHHRVFMRGGWGRGASDVHPFRVGAWRGPGSNTNTYARESHIDIMAAKAGINPLEFRLRNLEGNPRMKRVLKAAAERFKRKFEKAPSGRGFGISCVDYLNTYVATMAEVEVDKKTGKIQVTRVVCAQDMGEVINPEGARIQIDSCVTMGLGYTLSEEIHFKGGQVLDTNFDTYELPRFSWVPKIEGVLVRNPDLPPQGCGEPAITNMGSVVANAVYDAIGIRMFELPMNPERIRKAIEQD